MDREAWQATVHGVIRVRHDLVTKPQPPHFRAGGHSSESFSAFWLFMTQLVLQCRLSHILCGFRNTALVLLAHARQGLLVVMLFGWYWCCHQGYYLKIHDTFDDKVILYWVNFVINYFIWIFISEFLLSRISTTKNFPHLLLYIPLPFLSFFLLNTITNIVTYFISLIHCLYPSLKYKFHRTHSFVYFVHNSMPCTYWAGNKYRLKINIYILGLMLFQWLLCIEVENSIWD